MTKIIPIKELKIKETAARELPKDIEEGVQVYWNELAAKYPGMFNGALYSVINMENDDGIVTITCEPSDYAHYKYSEIKDIGEYACRSMYAGCILVSSDKKLFVFYSSLDSENILHAFDSFKKETGSNEIDRLISFGKDDMAELEKYESGQDIGVVDLLKIIMGEL
jgi:hypothetical protein